MRDAHSMPLAASGRLPRKRASLKRCAWWTNFLLAGICASMVGCDFGSDEKSNDLDSNAPDEPSSFVPLTISPDPAVVQQGSSIVVRFDVTGADNGGLTGYEIDFDERLSRVDIRTAACPPQLGRPACQDWTITPAANAVPGIYMMNVRTVGLGNRRIGTGNLQLQVAVSPAQQLGAAMEVAGTADNLTVRNWEGRIFNIGHNGSAQLGDGYIGAPFGADPAGPSLALNPQPDYSFQAFVEANVERLDFMSIARSDRAVYAVSRDGRVWHWGSRMQSRGGEGPVREDLIWRSTPAPVPGLEDIVAVSATESYGVPAYALGADGRVWFWGGDDGGEFPALLPGRTGMQKVVPGRTHNTTLYLHSSGFVMQSFRGGRDSAQGLPAGIVDIASASFSSISHEEFAGVDEAFLALDGAGEMYTWFHRRDGSFSTPQRATLSLHHVTAMAIGSFGTVYTLRQGSTSLWVHTLEDTLESQVREIPAPAGQRYVKVAAGGFGILEDCALAGGGSLVRIVREVGETIRHFPIIYSQFGSGDSCPTSRNDDAIISAAVQGGGKVISIPAGIDCDEGSCERAFRAGTRVQMVAVPDPGWRFSRWQSREGENPALCSLSPVANSVHPGIPLVSNQRLHCRAEFVEAPPEEFRLTVRLDNRAGVVTSAPVGIDCDPDCSHWFRRDAEVTLTAVPTRGYRFDGFRSARFDLAANQDDCRDGILAMNGPRYCQAVFTALPLPAAPAGLTATPTQTTVTLQWLASPEDIDGYRLERSQSGAPFELLTELGPTRTSFVDETVFVDTRYEYRLAAVSVHGAGASATVATTTNASEPPPVGTRWEQSGSGLGAGNSPALALDGQRQPVMAYLEADANGVDRVRVRRLVNGQWNDVGAPGQVLNPAPAQRAFEPAIAVDGQGRIVVAWGQAAADGQVWLMAVRSNGGGWDRLCGDATTCAVNFSPSTPARRPSLAIDLGGAPALAWLELGAPAVKRFDGTTWQAYGSGRGPVAAGVAVHIELAFGAASPAPHVAWVTEAMQDFVGVARFDINGWTHLGGTLVGSGSTSDTVIQDLALAVAPTGAPLVAWVQAGGGGDTRAFARRWAGNAWDELAPFALTTSAPFEGFAFALADDGTPYLALSTASATSGGDLDITRWVAGQWQAVAHRDGVHRQLSMTLGPQGTSQSPHLGWLRNNVVEAWRWIP